MGVQTSFLPNKLGDGRIPYINLLIEYMLASCIMLDGVITTRNTLFLIARHSSTSGVGKYENNRNT